MEDDAAVDLTAAIDIIDEAVAAIDGYHDMYRRDQVPHTHHRPASRY